MFAINLTSRKLELNYYSTDKNSLLGQTSSLFMFLCTVRKLENGLWQKLFSMTKYLVVVSTHSTHSVPSSFLSSWLQGTGGTFRGKLPSCTGHGRDTLSPQTRQRDAKINPNKFSIWKVLNVSTQIWQSPKTVKKCKKVCCVDGAKFEEGGILPS